MFSGALTLGARGDSYYEYLLKQWIQTQNIKLDPPLVTKQQITIPSRYQATSNHHPLVT